jgi:hypothetical protein
MPKIGKRENSYKLGDAVTSYGLENCKAVPEVSFQETDKLYKRLCPYYQLSAMSYRLLTQQTQQTQ